jgi:hypothetical protein
MSAPWPIINDFVSFVGFTIVFILSSPQTSLVLLIVYVLRSAYYLRDANFILNMQPHRIKRFRSIGVLSMGGSLQTTSEHGLTLTIFGGICKSDQNITKFILAFRG